MPYRSDRLLFELATILIGTRRISRIAIVVKPATILQFHRALVRRKYRALFTPKRRAKPGPKGPSVELRAAIVELKTKNPRFGCRRIVMIVSRTFGVDIDKDVDVVRRVLAQDYRPTPGNRRPSDPAKGQHRPRSTLPLAPLAGEPASP